MYNQNENVTRSMKLYKIALGTNQNQIYFNAVTYSQTTTEKNHIYNKEFKDGKYKTGRC